MANGIERLLERRMLYCARVRAAKTMLAKIEMKCNVLLEYVSVCAVGPTGTEKGYEKKSCTFL